MKKLLNSKLLYTYLILVIFTMALEITFRLISGINVFDYSLLRIFIGANILGLAIGFILSWLKRGARKVITLILTLLLTIYSFAQLGFNNFIGVYISVNTSSQLGAVVDYVREFLASFLGKYYFIFLPFLVLLIYLVFIDPRFKNKNDKKFVLKRNYKYEEGIRSIATVLVLTLFMGLYYESLTIAFMQNEIQTVSTKDLFHNPSVPSIVVNQFGILGFGFLDIKSAYTGVEEAEFLYANNNQEDVITNRTFDDTLWNSVIESETNKTYNNINNYLLNNAITDYNEYTGLFEGKNLIVIMMESVNDIFINEEYYPNFYKLYSEGWNFTNNYSPRNSCSTGNNEFSGMTGLYTIYNSCTANVYRRNTYFTSIFNLFNEKLYNTSSMHNYTEAYYYRSTIHTNLGSAKFYGVQDLGINYSNEYRNWSSDADFMDVAMDITLQDTTSPFMLWLTTVSSHQPYVVSSEEGDKYLDLFADTGYPTDLKRYMSKLKTLDEGLGILLASLEEKGILDDTVIALYGDHYPYGLNKNAISKVLDYDLDDYEIERVPFVIYNSAQEPHVFEQYTSYINITPTLANLFNLDYDPRLYMGSDILSPDYINVVTMADGSWKNGNLYYNASDGTITCYNDNCLTNEEVIEINNIITSKMQLSSMIIKNNYFSYLEKALNKAKANQEVLALKPEEAE